MASIKLLFALMACLQYATSLETTTPDPGRCQTNEGCPQDFYCAIGDYCYVASYLAHGNYTAMEKLCKSFDQEYNVTGHHLVSITSGFEEAFIQIQVSNVDIWLGLQREGDQWKWIDGSAFGYQKWASGEPGNDSCVILHMGASNQYGWYTRPCDEKAFGYCKIHRQ